jgi:hypothetical protein
MRDTSKRLVLPLPTDFGERITAARASQADYDRHVAPIVQWALAEFGSRRAAHDALVKLKYDDGTTDAAAALIDRAIVVVR